MAYLEKDIVRFWKKVKKASDDECWVWKASCRDGYGQVRIEKVLRSAHRVAYELTYGEIEGDLQVLHECDNRPCCNPKHLFLGTLLDNMKDRNKKGRQVSGTLKLTSEQIIEIRSRWATGNETQTNIAKDFGITPSWVSKLVNNKKRKIL